MTPFQDCGRRRGVSHQGLRTFGHRANVNPLFGEDLVQRFRVRPWPVFGEGVFSGLKSLPTSFAVM